MDAPAPPWPLGLAALAAGLLVGVAFPLVPVLVAPAGGLGWALAGIAGAWAGAFAAAIAVGGGPARHDPALAAGLGAGLAVAGGLVPLLDHGAAMLALGGALAGAGAGLLVAAARAYAAAALPPGRHDLAFGRLIALAGLGLLAGLPLAAGLAPQSLHLPPLVVASANALALAATLIAWPAAGEPGVVAGRAPHDHGKDG